MILAARLSGNSVSAFWAFDGYCTGGSHMRSAAHTTAVLTALLLASAAAPHAFRAQSPAQAFLDAYLHGTRLAITTNDIPGLISDLDRRADAWIRADPARAAERRRVVALAALDVARQDLRYLQPKLIEWACAFQRRSQTTISIDCGCLRPH
jgi:hypothetical protein